MHRNTWFSLVLAVGLGACGSETAGPVSDTQADASVVADLPRADAAADVGMEVGADAEPIPVVAAVFADPTFEVVVDEDLVYGQGLTHSDWGTADGTPMDLLLDVYRPIRDSDVPMPAVVLIHGGGFVGGSHKLPQISEMAHSFAERGWVAFAISYRLADDRGTLPQAYPPPPMAGLPLELWRALYPACRDAKAAIRWVRAQAANYGLQPDFIAAVGGSAGSFLAIALGVSDEADCTGEVDDANDPTLASTQRAQSARVQTVVDHWGGTSVVRMVEALNGGSRFDATDAPISIIHGTDDATVPFAQAEELRAEYQASGAPFSFHALEGAGHASWSAIIEGQTLTELAFDFIVEHQALTIE